VKNYSSYFSKNNGVSCAVAAGDALSDANPKGVLAMQLKLAGLLAFLAAASLVTACGGGDDEPSSGLAPTEDVFETEEATTANVREDNERDEPDEDALREAGQASAQAIVVGDAVKAYSFFHKSFKEKCSLNDYTAALAVLRAFYGESLEDAEVVVIDIRVEGNKGYIDGDATVDGRSLGVDDDDPNDITDDQPEDAWLWEDGKWWQGAFEPDPAPCDIGTQETEGA
jgi:hypothetical protein